jgi:hypothetical protein
VARDAFPPRRLPISCSRGLHSGLHPPFLLRRPAWNAARGHRPLQRGRSVFTFVIDYHHLSVDGGAGSLL